MSLGLPCSKICNALSYGKTEDQTTPATYHALSIDLKEL